MPSTAEPPEPLPHTVRRLHAVTESHGLALAEELIDCVAGNP